MFDKVSIVILKWRITQLYSPSVSNAPIPPATVSVPPPTTAEVVTTTIPYVSDVHQFHW